MGIMSSVEPSPSSTMATSKSSSSSSVRSPKPSILADGLVFAGGAAIALLLFWSLYALLAPSFAPSFHLSSSSSSHSHATISCPDRHADPPSTTFYDDPSLGYTIDDSLKNWDEKRRQWLLHHPTFLPGAKDRVLMVTGSQPTPCPNPIGDHLLLRFFKNKLDYCRLHGMDLFYNNALLHPAMHTFWAKIPLLRAAMAAHPEVEWLWWVDSDAALTDMDLDLPLHRYAAHNLVVHGWPHLVYEARSWTSLNAGVFLIRNCQWSLDFMDTWASMGPQTPNYDHWGQTLKAEFKDKVFPESDDQSGLVYLLLHEKSNWGDKIYLENEFYFEGYWLEIVGKLETIAKKYRDLEKRAPLLRRRRAEKVAAGVNGRLREGYLRAEGWKSGRDGWRRPFITHFTGCQPCSGDYNKIYSGERCYDGMLRALGFADDQVLRSYGFRRPPGELNSTAVRPLPYDFPAGV